MMFLLLLLVGEDEVLLDDSMRVAKKAEKAGVKVTLKIEPYMQHDWCFALPWLEQSKKAMKDMRSFIYGNGE